MNTDVDGPGALPVDDARRLIATALSEDLGPEHLDVTTMATFAPNARCTADLVARAPGVLAGGDVAALVLAQVAAITGSQPADARVHIADGTPLAAGDVVVTLSGSTRAILMAERTILNIMCRLSGVATHTRAWVEALDGTGARVLDTRKTTPGMRSLEKYAVRVGGGTNKRLGLYDVAMIKDNHKVAAGSLTNAYQSVLAAYPDIDIQVEVTSTAEALEAYAVGARFIMCDNMTPPLLAETVRALRGLGEPVEIEATGGLTLATVADYGRTGVDYLSVGALTHSSPILDLALDLAPL